MNGAVHQIQWCSQNLQQTKMSMPLLSIGSGQTSSSQDDWARNVAQVIQADQGPLKEAYAAVGLMQTHIEIRTPR